MNLDFCVYRSIEFDFPSYIILYIVLINFKFTAHSIHAREMYDIFDL